MFDVALAPVFGWDGAVEVEIPNKNLACEMADELVSSVVAVAVARYLDDQNNRMDEVAHEANETCDVDF